ncbi:hypothetical protein THAOC_06835 [Thalassiosira oceanica]|uniref:ATP-dependent DNA helicase n=1 Tax=Thalassiosira oceanica TaxID=159749 RepID=K0T1T6_THAOC|nr:hypothetical protein THAOC_06835 [Thalassiosira oceanica]|eukprot:EJK71700.1 hypothetical protein THAOC_06835 [Thalassiosira oceanica]
MATMILPHRPVPPTPDQSHRTEANRLEHNMGVIRQRFPYFSEDQVQAALQKMVKHEKEARLKAVEIWGNGALSEEEKQGRNTADIATAPTGCAASLIHGSTHHSMFKIPTKKANLSKPPSQRTSSNAEETRAHHSRMSNATFFVRDEHSMVSTEVEAWIEHEMRMGRQPQTQVLDDNLDPVEMPDTPDHPIASHVARRHSGGPDTAISFGDLNQIPPVAGISNYDSRPGNVGTAACVGRVKLSEFRNGCDGCESTVVIMNTVVRQDDPVFKEFLGRMRQANRQSFEYLNNVLTTPIAIVRAALSTNKASGKNCCANGSVLPLITPICVGAKVILLENNIVEDALINGSIGEIRQICYAPDQTMGQPGAEMYCVVSFPKSNLAESTVVGASDTKLVPIPLTSKRCEKGCCTIKTLPLRVCYALTVHKVQGMSIGAGETFEKAVVHFAEGRMANIPGLMLTAFTRVKGADDLAVGTESNSLTVNDITKIGATKAYKKKKEFRKQLEIQSQQSMQRTIDRITALDNQNTAKTFEGGCDFLLQWYRNNFSPTTTD